MGLVIKRKIVPYKRMVHELKTGDCDFAIFYRSPFSDEIASAEVRVFALRNVVVGKVGTDLLWYQDLFEHTIAVPSGAQYFPRFDNDPRLKKSYTRGFSSAIKQFLTGRVSLIVGPDALINYHLQKEGKKTDILGEALFLNYRAAWMQISHQSPNMTPEIREKIINGIKTLHNKGIITAIMKKHKIYNRKYLTE